MVITNTYGAQWYRCDLHVHTPFDGTKDFPVDLRGAIETFKKKDDSRLREVAKSFIEACENVDGNKGLDLIAITDHNNIEGYKTLKPFFEEIISKKKEGGERYTTILPGVEISVGSERNVHFLVIFSKNTEATDIENCIRHIFGSKEPFDADGIPQPTTRSITEFLKNLHDWCKPAEGDRNIPYLVIPAHAGSSQGVAKETGSYQKEWISDFWEETQGKLRELAINRTEWHGFHTKRPFERLPEAFRENICKWYAAKRDWNWDKLPREKKNEIRSQKYWPLLEASDPNNFEAIGNRFTWLKLEERDLEGIRLALLDPESRLRRMDEGPPKSEYTFIKRIGLQNTDFFEDLEIAFNPSLNTLIGGRGSGKSSVLESIRHLTDKDQKRDFIIENGDSSAAKDIYKQVEEMLTFKSERDLGENPGIFLNDSKFELDFVSEGTTYRIKKQGGESKEFFKIEDGSNLKPIPFEDVKQLLKPNILSQQQIAAIAKDPSAQRREIDLLIDTSKRERFNDRKRNIIEQIKSLQSKRARLIEEHASLPSKRTELLKVKEDIDFLEEKGNKETLKSYEQLQNEEKWIEESVSGIDKVIEYLRGTLEDIKAVRKKLSTPADDFVNVLQKMSHDIDDNFKNLIKELDELVKNWKQFKDDIEEGRQKEWLPRREEINSLYKELLNELEEKGVPFEKHEKKVQRRSLLQKEVNHLDSLTEEIKQLNEEIESQRKILIELHLKRVEERKEIALYLEEEDADIRFKINPFMDRNSFETNRTKWFGGAGLHKDDWKLMVDFCFQADGQIAERISKLYKDIRSDIKKTLSKKELLRPEESELANLFDDHGLDQPTGHYYNVLEDLELTRIDEMEYFLPEDEVKAQVRSPGGSFKPISQGSIGQKSTAILSLLLSAGNEPLIIDQPENDLDNQYIYDVVVDLLRKKKFQRQIIIATHNANIPVNGDAEQIIALQVNNDQMGEVAAIGSIDKAEIKNNVSVIMEGSPEAFRLRKERYGY